MARTGPLRIENSVAGWIKATLRVFIRAPLFFTLLLAIQYLSSPLLDLFAPSGSLSSAFYGSLDFFVSEILFAIVQAPVIARASQLLAGEPTSFRRLLAVTASRAFPLCALVIGKLVLVVLGSIAFVIPGIVATLAFALAEAVCVLDKASPVKSLRRSAELTRGIRWRLLGAYVVLAVPTLFVVVSTSIAQAKGVPPMHNVELVGTVFSPCREPGRRFCRRWSTTCCVPTGANRGSPRFSPDMEAFVETTQRLPIRATVGASYAVVAKAPVGMLGLAAVPLLGLVLLTWAAFQAVEPVLNGAVYLVVFVFAGFLVQYALFVLILGTLIRGAARVDRKQPFGLKASIAASLRRLPQLTGASFYLFVMGTSLFYALFSQPSRIEYALPFFLLGLLAALLLALSLPVCLIEGRGPIASMTRAFALARGSRWRLVAAVFIALVPIVGLTILLLSVIPSHPITMMIAPLGFMTMTAVLAALTAVAYGRLAPPGNAAAVVFD